MGILIRPENAADIAAIHALTAEAFREVEHSSQTEPYINDALRASGQLTLSLVAVDREEIAGHVAVSPVRLSDGTSGWFGLGPVAVLPERQREGIGSRLIKHALDELRQLGASVRAALRASQRWPGRQGCRAPLRVPCPRSSSSSPVPCGA